MKKLLETQPIKKSPATTDNDIVKAGLSKALANLTEQHNPKEIVIEHKLSEMTFVFELPKTAAIKIFYFDDNSSNMIVNSIYAHKIPKQLNNIKITCLGENNKYQYHIYNIKKIDISELGALKLELENIINSEELTINYLKNNISHPGTQNFLQEKLNDEQTKENNLRQNFRDLLKKRSDLMKEIEKLGQEISKTDLSIIKTCQNIEIYSNALESAQKINKNLVILESEKQDEDSEAPHLPQENDLVIQSNDTNILSINNS